MSMVGAKAFAYDVAVENEDGVTIYYSFTNNNTELAVTHGGTYGLYSGKVVIPESVTFNGNTYNVTSIAGSAFLSCSSLTSVCMPNNIVSIGTFAFEDCTTLTEVIMSNNVKSIEKYAFLNCSSLPEITIPGSVISIGNSLFEGCSSLKEMTISDSMNELSMSSDLFNWDCHLEKLYVGRNLTGSNPFNINQFLNTLIIGDSVTEISREAFSGCSSLSSVTIGCSVALIGYSAFSGCSRIAEVNIGNSVTTIGEYAFKNCSGLTKMTLSNSVTEISREAFSGCSSLTEVTIPNNVTEMGVSVFSGCSNLKMVTFSDGVEILKMSTSKLSGGIFDNCPIERVYLGRPLNYTNYSPFQGKKTIKTLTIGDNVTSIGSSLFDGCSGMTGQLIIPNNVTSIGSSAFYGCTSLNSVTIGSGVTSIGYNAFSKPKKVIWLTKTPPSGYANANGVVNYVTNEQYTSLSNTTVYPLLSSMLEVGGVKYIPVNVSERTCDVIDCVYDESAENIHIDSTIISQGISLTVKQVRPYALYNNEYIKNAVLNLDGDIDEYAFYGCTALETIQLNNNGKIGNYSFYGCTALGVAELDICGDINDYSFYGCTSLKNITIGNNVPSIGDRAFYGCSGLDHFEFGSAMKSIGKEAFSDCTAMTKLVSHATTPPICDSQALDDINKWICTLSVPMGYATAYQQAEQWKDFFFINDDVEVPEDGNDGSGDDTPNDDDVDSGVQFTKDTPQIKARYDLNGKQLYLPQRGLNIIRMNDGTTKKIIVK